MGKGANIQEKSKAAQVLDTFTPRFRGVTKVRLDGSETTPEFWELLGGEVPIADAAASGEDTEVESVNVRKIFTVDGPSQFTFVAEGLKATRDVLKGSQKVSIIQRGESIIVYLPKSVSPDVKKGALNTGTDFLKAQGLPTWYSVSCAKEGVRDDVMEMVFI
jgi:hypothetical protein